MKCFASRFFNILLKLSAAISACVGCTPKQEKAPQPRPIRWRGPETGYTGATAVDAVDATETAGKTDGKERP